MKKKSEKKNEACYDLKKTTPEKERKKNGYKRRIE